MFLKNRGEIFQVILSFAFGLFVGSYALSLELSIIFLLINEIIVFIYSSLFSKRDRLIVRLSATCSYLLGWILGRWLITDETGFENFCSNCS